MKTIAFNKSRGSLFTTLAVIGGLTAFYFYRRRGGKILPLVQNGIGAISGRVNLKDAAENVINTVSEKAAPIANKISSRRSKREVSTSTVDMDSLPST